MDGNSPLDDKNSNGIFNFDIDSYLQLIRTTAAQNGLCVEVFLWEEFE